MADKPNINSLHLMLVRVDCKLDNLIKAQDEIKEWQKSHKKDDDKEHDLLHTRISTIKKYGPILAIICTAIGYSTDKIANLFKG